MIVNQANLNGIFVNLKTTFNQSFLETASTWQQVAMLVPSTGAYNDYKWVGSFPKMREWVGEKTLKNLSASNYVIANKDFEATVEVNRNDIEDDNLGILKPQAEMVGWSAKQFPDELVFGLVNNAFVEKCFDGQPFFSTNHKVGKTTVSNMFTKPLSIATLAEATGSFGAARTKMLTFKDEEGRPLRVRPTILLVPPALGDTARALMTVDRLEDGKPNPYKGVCTVVEEPNLISDTAWFLLDTSKPIKPFIFQERKKPIFVQQNTPESDNVFMHKQFRYGVEARANVGFSFWQLAFGSTGTGA